jgi:hypothetical protein
MQRPDPRERIKTLRSETRELLRNYRDGLDSFKRHRDLGPMAAGELASRIFNFPRARAEKMAKAVFQKDWKTTPEYAGFAERFRDLRNRTSEFLNSLAEKQARGYRRGLAYRLREVDRVVRLDTKLGKLTGVLDDLETGEVLYRDDVLKAKRRSRSAPKPRVREPDSADWNLALGLVAVFVAVASAVSIPLLPVVGSLAYVAGIGAATLVLLGLILSRRSWAPRLRRFLGR